METIKKMGRQPLPETEKKERIVAFVPNKMVKLLGNEQCKIIAQNAIIAEYDKRKGKK